LAPSTANFLWQLKEGRIYATQKNDLMHRRIVVIILKGVGEPPGLLDFFLYLPEILIGGI